SGVPPWRVEVDDLKSTLPEIVAGEVAAAEGGKLAVIVPSGRENELADLLTPSIEIARGREPSALDAPAVVLTVPEAKGLEFDVVLAVEPAEIMRGSQRGMRDLYVAVTRATQQLGVVHTGELPSSLQALRPREPALSRS